MLQLGNKITVGEPIYKFQNNHSVDFDGVDDFIQLGEPISYTQHTISTWVKITNSGSSKTIFDSRDSANDGIRLRTDSSENIIYRVNDSALTSTNSYVDEWVHIVCTYDGTTQKLYINGSLDQSATTSQTVSVTTNAKIGARNFDDRAVEFLGKIDELGIYDRALTAAEVTQIYRIKYGANLVQNGRFDELGSELARNGNFDTSIPIGTAGSYWEASTGSAEYHLGGVKMISDNSNICILLMLLADNVTLILPLEKTFKITYTVLERNDIISTGFTIYMAGNNHTLSTDLGTHTFYLDSGNNINKILQFQNNTFNSDITIGNVTVKQVDPNDRWLAGASGAAKQALTDVATLTPTGSFDIMLRQNGILTSGKKYKITYNTDLSGITSGSFKWQTFSESSGARTILNGTNTVILTANGSDLYVSEGGASGTGIFTFIMVEEQKYVATNLKLNSGNYKSADPVIVSTKSVDFDGSDAYLDAGDVGNVKTLSFWFNPDSDITDSSPLIRLFGFSGTSYIGISLGNSTGMLVGEVLTVLPNGDSRTGTTHTFKAGRWYHVAVVWNETEEYYDIFINGVARTDLNTGTGVNSNFDSFLIGTANDTSNFFNGQIDEVGIFSSSLTSDQVIELYNQGVPSNLLTHSANANLTGYWKMGDGTLDEAGLIADQTNATLGSELVTNGDFATDSDWTKGTGWSIANGKASRTAQSGSTACDQSLSLNAGSTYKITYDLDISAGTFHVRFAGTTNVNGQNRTTSGTYEDYLVAATGNNQLRLVGGDGSFVGSIDNVSVKQVNGNPALMENTPTIVTDAPLTKIRNYYRMGDGILDKFPLICDMIEPSLGSELVTDGGFTDASNWDLTGTATISDGTGNFSNADGSFIIQDNVVSASVKVYKLEYEVVESNNGNLRLSGGASAFGTVALNSSIGVHSIFLTSNGSQDNLQFNNQSSFIGKIDNVSVKQVNGVPGMMTNMTEADITNDVPS